MAYGKKKVEHAPYETLSDLAIGSLGVFLILVVVIVVISSLHSSGTSDVFEKIKSENNYFRSQIVKAKKESSNYKSNDFAKKEIRLIRREYDKISRKLDRSREKLLFEKELVKKKAEKFGEVSAAIDVLDQQKKESANLIIEMDKLKAQLESLVDIQTGSGVDRTGTPYFTYGTGASTSGDSLFLIGDSASLTIPQFLDLIQSVKNNAKDKDGFSTFFYQFSRDNSVWRQDSYKPLWVWSKTGFVEAKVRRKY
tara:strand:- start:367 stop:1125 length:759 start_codon:yes stop_codon:yes gene_type:complete